MPPSLEVVPVKYLSTSSWESPSASKIWAPVYDATVETPIFDITLSTPLPSDFTRLATAFSGSTLDVEPVAGEVLDGLHREVGVDRRGAVPDEQRDVVHLADVAGLDEQADLGAGLLAHQVVVHGGGHQQRRDRRLGGVGVAVGEHDHAGAARRSPR